MPIVEAVYALDVSLHAWMQRLLNTAETQVGWGLGGVAFVFSIGSSGMLEIDRQSSAVLGRSSEAMAEIVDRPPHAPWNWVCSCVQVSGEIARCLITSEVDRERRAPDDEVNLVCADLDRRGALVSLGIPAGGSVTPGMRANLARVATHILAALRLRRRLGQYEHAGQRQVAVRESVQGARNLPELKLTPTERSVVVQAARGLTTKEVAYTLGINDATVRVLLMRAARRCGARSRAELLTLGRQALSAVASER